MRSGALSWVGVLLFGGGIIAMWLTAEYANDILIGMIIGSLLAVAGLCLGLYGGRQDMQRFNEQKPEGLLPPANALSLLGGIAIGLGAVGLILIAMEGAWDNTAWVIVEVGSLALGLIMGGIGIWQEIKLKQSLAINQPEPTPTIDTTPQMEV